MKKILLFFLTASCTLFCQNNSSSNILKLQNDSKITINKETHFSEPQIFQNDNKKSAGLAILYSLLLPGMGELYAESYSSGKYFTIAEGTLWLTYIGMNSYGNWKKDRYKSFAASNAGVNLKGKDEDYFATIGEYVSIEQFNNEKALERNFDEMYPQSHAWSWTGQERDSYRDMWVSSELAYNNLRFVVGALILNRIISAINAVRLVSNYNDNLQSETSWNISVGMKRNLNLPSALTLDFRTSF